MRSSFLFLLFALGLGLVNGESILLRKAPTSRSLRVAPSIPSLPRNSLWERGRGSRGSDLPLRKMESTFYNGKERGGRTFRDRETTEKVLLKLPHLQAQLQT